MSCAVNNCPTSIITGGLGQPAKNSAIFGMSRLNIKLCTPHPTVTPTVTPTPPSLPMNHHGINRDEDYPVSFRLQWYNHGEMLTTFKKDENVEGIIFKINTEITMKQYTFKIKHTNMKGFKVTWIK